MNSLSLFINVIIDLRTVHFKPEVITGHYVTKGVSKQQLHYVSKLSKIRHAKQNVSRIMFNSNFHSRVMAPYVQSIRNPGCKEVNLHAPANRMIFDVVNTWKTCGIELFYHKIFISIPKK